MHSTSTLCRSSHHIDKLAALKQSTLHRRAAAVPEHADGDHLVKGAVELVAAAHVADQHEVGTDHAGQLEARVRLADHAQAAQSIMPPPAVTAWAASFGARP